MKSTEFCYWLQGLFELGNPKALDERQTDLIKRHLHMVFLHEIDPSYPADQQVALDNAHEGKPVNRMNEPATRDYVDAVLARPPVLRTPEPLVLPVEPPKVEVRHHHHREPLIKC